MILNCSLPALLRTPARELSRRVRWLLVGAVCFYSLLGALIMHRWQQRSGQSLASLGFGYGALITAMESTGQYRVLPGVHHPEVSFSAHRLPFIPYFLVGLKRLLGDNLGRVALAKCLIFGALLAAAVGLVLLVSPLPLGVLLLLLAPALTMPRWVLNVFEVSLEEGYNIPALALLFALLWFSPARRRRGIGWTLGVGFLLGLLLFLKSSMLYWCLAVPVLVWLQERRLRRAAFLFALVGAALLLLGSFNARHSGRFTVASSWEGWNLFKGNCEHTAAAYPPYSLDLLDYEGKVVADRPLQDEWDHNSYFRAKAVEFIRSHPLRFCDLVLRKTWIFYGEVRASGLSRRDESRYGRPVYLLQIPWMVVFRILQCTAILLALRTLWQTPWSSDPSVAALSFLAFLALYSGFHLVGFAYERHIMPVVMPTILYLLHVLAENRICVSFPAVLPAAVPAATGIR
jgi:hypothetical protein